MEIKNIVKIHFFVGFVYIKKLKPSFYLKHDATMNIYAELPKEIRFKIYYYAIPKIDENTKRAIEVTSAHQCFQRMYSMWCRPYFDRNGERVHPPFSWEEMIYRKTNKEKRQQLFRALSNCGCCERHSCGVYDKPHCFDIVGSHTTTKYHKKYTYYGKSCNCWCRLQMRSLQNIAN